MSKRFAIKSLEERIAPSMLGLLGGHDDGSSHSSSDSTGDSGLLGNITDTLDATLHDVSDLHSSIGDVTSTIGDIAHVNVGDVNVGDIASGNTIGNNVGNDLGHLTDIGNNLGG